MSTQQSLPNTVKVTSSSHRRGGEERGKRRWWRRDSRPEHCHILTSGTEDFSHIHTCQIVCAAPGDPHSLSIYIYSIEGLVDKFILIHSWCDQLMVDTWHTGHVKRHRGQQRTIVIFISCNRRNTNVYCKGHTCRRCSKNRASSKKQLGWRRKVQERFSLLSSPAPRTVI